MGCAVTQNSLAGHVRRRGWEPRSPGPGEPNFDLALVVNGIAWVAEVKSLTEANEEKQLRLGLGQVLRVQSFAGYGFDSDGAGHGASSERYLVVRSVRFTGGHPWRGLPRGIE